MSTRDELVEATCRILRRDGLAKLSTRLVAREAGVSEGALYKHFQTKEELLVAAVDLLIAPYSAITAELPHRVGLGSVAETLADLVVANYTFLRLATPIWGSLHADPALHERYLALLRERDLGPHHAMALLARFIAAEQRLGRLNPALAPDAVANTLMAIAHFHASMDAGFKRPDDGAAERVRHTLSVALAGLVAAPLTPSQRSSP